MSCNPTPACLITAAQAALEASFADTVIVKRLTAVQSDGAGGRKPTSGDGYTTVSTNAGRLETTRLRPGERVIGSQITSPAPFAIYLNPSVDVRTKDRLVIGTRTFEAVMVSKAAAGAIVQRVNCTELQT